MRLNDKVEAVLVELVQTALTAAELETPVYPGRRSGERADSCVVCAADGDDGEEDPPNSGNCWINAVIQIRHAAAPDPEGTEADDDPESDEQGLADAAFGPVMVDDLPALLTSTAAGIDPPVVLTVMGAIRKPVSSGVENDTGVWVDELPVRIYCGGFA